MESCTARMLYHLIAGESISGPEAKTANWIYGDLLCDFAVGTSSIQLDSGVEPVSACYCTSI